VPFFDANEDDSFSLAGLTEMADTATGVGASTLPVLDASLFVAAAEGSCTYFCNLSCRYRVKKKKKET